MWERGNEKGRERMRRGEGEQKGKGRMGRGVGD